MAECRDSGSTYAMSPPPNPMIDASPQVRELLGRLHALSLEQEVAISAQAAALRHLPEEERKEPLAALMRDKFIALDQDKCEFIYTLLRATNARHVVEAGTSFGVSTIYLALAVSQNHGNDGRVIATEHEPEKARRAREHWAEAGSVIEDAIDLREGDLRQTLKVNMPQVDFLLLDIWTPMALPTLEIVLPHLRPGAIVVADNTISFSAAYADLLAVLRSPSGPFRSVVLPYSNGLEFSVYVP
ncbi:S-adenosyl-L-methionine-dependent methyltransferase [Exidia glandulosa HHB12029]|uniref:S-adenosyl-L-methionine-dependent methyltransferase n=1 Tax=Exidia glandulosa HHB12029 TaxID=1314781 RepID=A0A165PA15_EXIGL|nr:S-adenosyl-L-methionine-dependent methyltransferase [Exidia glandulosa HHB12029]